MGVRIITTDDLREFKIELLEDIKNLIAAIPNADEKWIKSTEVRDMLGISPGTLQNLRINGTIPYSKIGGVLYYNYRDILKILEQNRIDNQY